MDLNPSKAMNSIFKKVIGRMNRIKKPLVKICIFYLALLILIIVTWFGAWWYVTVTTEKPDLKSLMDFLSICIGPAALACITFVAGFFIDSNGNKIPDIFEKGGYNTYGNIERNSAPGLGIRNQEIERAVSSGEETSEGKGSGSKRSNSKAGK